MLLRSTRTGSTVAIALPARASPYRIWLWINHGRAITNAAGTTANRCRRTRQGALIRTITAASTIAIANPLSFDKNASAAASAAAHAAGHAKPRATNGRIRYVRAADVRAPIASLPTFMPQNVNNAARVALTSAAG